VITPLKLRAALLRARAEGRTYEEVATLLGIGRATVNGILRLHRATNSLELVRRSGIRTSRSGVTRACATRVLSNKILVATERDTPKKLKRREEFRALLN
jgi:predicted transcriptional regulator